MAGVILLDGSNPDYTATQKRPSKYFIRYGTLKNSVINNIVNTLNNFGITRLVFDTTDAYYKIVPYIRKNTDLIDNNIKEIDEAMFVKQLNNKNHLEELRMDRVDPKNNIGNIPLRVITSSLYLTFCQW